jgi:competence protein ComEC
MPSRALRRPLFWLLLVYMAGLLVLRSRGFFAALGSGRPGAATLEAVIDSPLKETRQGWQAEARTQAGRALVRWSRTADADTLPLPGETARIGGRLRRPRPARNPGDFDEAAFLADRGVAWVLEARDSVRLERPIAWSDRPRLWAERLHRWVRRRLRGALPPDRARLAEGFALGYKGALAVSLNRAVQDSGLIHLIVPSGAKVAVALAAAAALSALLRLAPWPRIGLLGGAGLVVVLAAGGEPPYWRAYLAVLEVLVARACGRESDAFQALLVSAWLQLLAWPRALFSAGFQMSYLAMLGLATLGPALRRFGALGVAVAVQAALWPVFAQTFGRGALVGALANAVAVPAYPAFAALAWSVCALPALAPLLSAGLAAFERLCFFAASLPAAVVPLSPWPWTSIGAYYLTLVGFSQGRTRRGAVLLGGALALRLGAALEARAAAPALRVVYLKVPPLRSGPRYAALVTFAGRRTWLVGGAPASLVLKACRAYGLDRPDGELPSSPNLKLCRGAVCLGFEQSAIIAAPAEVSTDGLEVHVKTR